MEWAVTASANGCPAQLDQVSVTYGQAHVRETFEAAWWEEIENSGARGDFKKALRTWVEHDVQDILESLRDAPTATRHAWLEFVATWAKAEVKRLLKLLTLWRNKEKAKRKKGRLYGPRTTAKARDRRLLCARILDHVRSRGGSVPYAPAAIAKALSGSRRTLSPDKVRRHMLQLVRQRQARKVGRGIDVSFALSEPVQAAPKA